MVISQPQKEDFDDQLRKQNSALQKVREEQLEKEGIVEEEKVAEEGEHEELLNRVVKASEPVFKERNISYA